jgi:hypothetical protein
MPLTPDARPPVCGGFDVTFFMRDGDKLVECLVLPSAFGVLESGSIDTERERLCAFERHAARFHALASAKYDDSWIIPIIGEHDLPGRAP